MSAGGLGRLAVEALGVRLRDLRRDAGLTGRQLASACSWPPSKVTKIEYGRQTPSESDVRDWCIACGFPSEISDLIAALRTVDAQMVDWRRSLRSGTKLRQQAAVDAYEKTTLFRIWEPAVVPGLAQTPDYARGILRTVVDFHGVPDDVEDGVRARIDAQRVLTHGDRRFLLLLGQAALYTFVTDAGVMRDQLQRLLEVSRMPRVTLGVVPLAAPYTVPRNNAFTLYDNRFVTVATYTAELTLNQHHEIATYASAFDRLLHLAERGEGARSLIEAALNDLEEI
ncbi:helix-turn-helix transcriptional regulator [Phytohabitans sp. ZYX-F-186]|uniref:Helix-turn-helix transcriptional regulator n=1 Tax=Phytohabitans maris TaxID=3071409 RepID=A0ABU0Z9S5_9ACTN|nr:helix-turn-helix transcriptional regulator [Phytohabitans sp. ZYX-F-186]MDQ7903077.1 helix-turn-helix transcriptional regulator [Phytohabitans sp. ZYX-F-186]